MRVKVLVGWVLLGSLFLGTPCQAQLPSTPPAAGQPIGVDPQPSAATLDQFIERIVARENVEVEALSHFSPITETYIQEGRPDKQLGIVPKSDFYFLGQADFRARLKVHSLLEREKKGNWMWSYEPAGFLQMFFVDRGEFDKLHYRFKYERREFLEEVRCYVFYVSPAPKTRRARFVGRIWVEDHDISWRTNVKSGLWLPSYVYTQELDRSSRLGGPSFKAQTRLWGYRLTPTAREAELNRLLVESSTAIQEEAPQHDRSPLEAQREWRHEAENNIVELLEDRGLLAPQGEAEKALNTIAKNLEIANNLDEQVDFHCRVLLTTNLEMFSVGDTIVLSRGLIDVVPDEATMAAMLAHGMADAMLPKPNQDQYAFSDIMRLMATEVLKRISFQEEKTEAEANSAKAMELLNKSTYASKLEIAGLFLAQLHSQSKPLRRLISPQLGNQVYFDSRLIQAAPAPQPNNKDQITALPLGSRLKIDPWTGALSLKKSKPVPRLSLRDKMPFDVTPDHPYLMRYVETTSSTESSDLFAPCCPALPSTGGHF